MIHLMTKLNFLLIFKRSEDIKYQFNLPISCRVVKTVQQNFKENKMIIQVYQATFKIEILSLFQTTSQKADFIIQVFDSLENEPIYTSPKYSMKNLQTKINQIIDLQTNLFFDHETKKFLHKSCQIIVSFVSSSTQKVLLGKIGGKIIPNLAETLNNSNHLFLDFKKHKLLQSSIRGTLELKITAQQRMPNKVQQLVLDRLLKQFYVLYPQRKGKVQIKNNGQNYITKISVKKQDNHKSNIINRMTSIEQYSSRDLQKSPRTLMDNADYKEMHNDFQQIVQQNSQKKNESTYPALQKISSQNEEQKNDINAFSLQAPDLETFIKYIKTSTGQIENLTTRINCLEKQKEQMLLKESQLLSQLTYSNVGNQRENKMKDYYTSREQNMKMKYEIAELTNENQYLNKQIQKKDHQLKELKEVISNLEQQKQQLISKLNDEKLTIKAQIEALCKIQTEKQDFVKLYHKQQIKNIEKNSQICELSKRIEALQSVINKKNETIESLEARLNSLNDTEIGISSLKNLLTQKQQQIKLNKITISQLSRQRQKNKEKLQLNMLAIQNITQQNKRLRLTTLQQIEQYKHIIEEIQFKHKKALKNLQNEHQKNRGILQSQIEKKVYQLKIHQQKQQYYKTRQQQLKKNVQIVEQQLSKIFKIVEEKDKYQQQLQEKIKEYENWINNLEQELYYFRNNKSTIKNIEIQNQQLKSKISLLEAINVDPVNRQQWAIVGHKNTKSQHGKQQNQRSTLERQKSISTQNHILLAEQIKTLRRLRQQLTMQLVTKSKTFEETQLKLLTFQNEIKRFQNELELAEAKNNYLNNEVTRLKQKNSQLQVMFLNKQQTKYNIPQLLKQKQKQLINLQRTMQKKQEIGIMQLQHKFLKKKLAMEQLEKKISVLQASMAKIKQENIQLKEENSSLKIQCKQYCNKVLELKQKNKQLAMQSSQENMEVSLKSGMPRLLMQTQQKSFERMIQKLNNQLTVLQIQHQSDQRKMSQLSIQNQQLKKQNKNQSDFLPPRILLSQFQENENDLQSKQESNKNQLQAKIQQLLRVIKFQQQNLHKLHDFFDHTFIQKNPTNKEIKQKADELSKLFQKVKLAILKNCNMKQLNNKQLVILFIRMEQMINSLLNFRTE